uniref:Uncharacterized protein n=1 Tax=Physcomitrium patens TaxID=3218 RepID=A0A2K1IHV2_PHYPA|nr:hypothetical protein PHYPA_027549 [Physcomitrium patens]
MPCPSNYVHALPNCILTLSNDLRINNGCVAHVGLCASHIWTLRAFSERKDRQITCSFLGFNAHIQNRESGPWKTCFRETVILEESFIFGALLMDRYCRRPQSSRPLKVDAVAMAR